MTVTAETESICEPFQNYCVKHYIPTLSDCPVLAVNDMVTEILERGCHHRLFSQRAGLYYLEIWMIDFAVFSSISANA